MERHPINEKLDRMSQGGRQAVYREMADESPIGDIFQLDGIYRQQVVKLLKLDPEARFVLKLSDKGNKGLKKNEVQKLRSANGGHLEFLRDTPKTVSFRNAMHLYYTYGPEAPVAQHRGLIECAGRATSADVDAKGKQSAKMGRLESELERAKAAQAKAEAELEALKAAQAKAE